jgi:hypothetical protein
MSGLDADAGAFAAALAAVRVYNAHVRKGAVLLVLLVACADRGSPPAQPESRVAAPPVDPSAACAEPIPPVTVEVRGQRFDDQTDFAAYVRDVGERPSAHPELRDDVTGTGPALSEVFSHLLDTPLERRVTCLALDLFIGFRAEDRDDAAMWYMARAPGAAERLWAMLRDRTDEVRAAGKTAFLIWTLGGLRGVDEPLLAILEQALVPTAEVEERRALAGEAARHIPERLAPRLAALAGDDVRTWARALAEVARTPDRARPLTDALATADPAILDGVMAALSEDVLWTVATRDRVRGILRAHPQLGRRLPP